MQQLGIQSVKLETMDLEILDSTAIEVGRAHLETKTGPVKVKFVVVRKKEPEACVGTLTSSTWTRQLKGQVRS